MSGVMQDTCVDWEPDSEVWETEFDSELDSEVWGTPCLTGCCRTWYTVTRTWRRTSAASRYWGDMQPWLSVYRVAANESAFDISKDFSASNSPEKTLIEMHSENKQEVFPNLLIFASFLLLSFEKTVSTSVPWEFKGLKALNVKIGFRKQ